MDVVTIILFCLLSMILLVPWVIEKEFITPLKIYSVLTILTTLPYLIYLINDSRVMHYAILSSFKINDISSSYQYYMIIQSLGSLALFLGYYSLPLRRSRNSRPVLTELASRQLVKFSLFIYAASLFFFYLKLNSVGGLFYLLDNKICNLERCQELTLV